MKPTDGGAGQPQRRRAATRTALRRSRFNSLTALKFGDGFNQRVAALCLPDGLRSLEFGEAFHGNRSALRLPPSLTALDLGGFSGSAADLPALPPSLEQIEFGWGVNAPL